MPFRIKVTLVVLCSLLGLLLIGPLIVPIRPLPDTVSEAELAGPDSRFVEVNGLDVHYREVRERGAGRRALVLLHGFGSSAASFAQLMDPLAAHGRVVAFDRPAFGLTERPLPGGEWSGANPYTFEAQVALTLALMDALGLQDAVLVGHSSGGAVALGAALAAPERVSGLVLLGPAVYRTGGPPAASRWLLHTPQLDRIGPLFMRQLGGEPGRSFLEAAWSDPSRIGPETLEAYRRPLRAEGWDRALWEFAKASRDPDLAPRLPEVSTRALVVSGADDAIVPSALGERLANELPAAEFALLQGCGHLPQEECPAALLEVLETWLQDGALVQGAR